MLLSESIEAQPFPRFRVLPISEQKKYLSVPALSGNKRNASHRLRHPCRDCESDSEND